MLERREHDGLGAEHGRLGLELARERQQQALVAAADAAAVGDQLERRPGRQWLVRAERQAVDGGSRRAGGERAGAPEQPALAEGRAERARPREVRLGLDPLGQQHRAGALGLGGDRVERAAAGEAPRAWISDMSSLMTSGARNGIRASERASMPTSSSAIPHPRSRSHATAASTSAGRSVSARSVSSTTTRRRPVSSSSSWLSGASSPSTAAGSMLTNSASGGGSLRRERALDGGGAAGAVELVDDPERVRRAEQLAR